MGEIPRPKLVLVTGDVAYSGAARSPTEYEDATEWLDGVAAALDLSRRDVYIVPGNHDVRRQEPQTELLTHLREGKKPLDDALDEKEAREHLLGRLQPFLAFSRQFAPEGTPSDAALEKGQLDWMHLRIERGVGVALVGLNSALLANGPDALERGHLRLGFRQLDRLNGLDRSSELVLVLTHHPVDYLGDQDNAVRIGARAHAHLFGHIHGQNSLQLRFGHGSELVRVIAGSVHASDVYEDFGFSLGAVYAHETHDGRELKLTLRIWPWTHVANQSRFRLDRFAVPEAKSFAEHPLGSIRRPAPLRLPDQSVLWLAGALQRLHQEAPQLHRALHQYAQGRSNERALLQRAESGQWELLLSRLNEQPEGVIELLARSMPHLCTGDTLAQALASAHQFGVSRDLRDDARAGRWSPLLWKLSQRKKADAFLAQLPPSANR